jgi:hypothetical protein
MKSRHVFDSGTKGFSVTIESNIPLPRSKKKGRPRSEAYSLLRQLKVGESIFVTAAPSTVRAYLYSPPAKDLREQGFKFVREAAVKDEVPGTRIWRIK